MALSSSLERIPISLQVGAKRFCPSLALQKMAFQPLLIPSMPMIIAVDFDGTLCVDNNYPNITSPNTTLFSFLIARRNSGDKIVLWTCREGKELQEAVDWCRELGLEFDAVNENVLEIPFYSRKVVADMYIDDLAVNVKLF